MLEVAEFKSPIGTLAIAVEGGRLCAVSFEDRLERRSFESRFGAESIVRADDPAGVITRLGRYFSGDLAALDGIAVDPAGTQFQRRVWSELRTIPAGRTASYRDIAIDIGKPAAVRAVGAANGANPIAIVVPCHRVIGSNGHLTGYGGGLERKRWLLAHEGALGSFQREMSLRR